MHILIHKYNEWTRIFSPNDNICNYYLINKQCIIFSEYSGKYLKQVVTENGYLAISLNTKEGLRIQRKAHRLGMMSFKYFPNCENYQVNHIDGNKLNNDIDSNLEWVTPSQNINHAIENNLRKSWNAQNNPHTNLNNEQVLDICNLCLSGKSDIEIIQKYPFINLNIIRSIIYGHSWNNITDQQILAEIIKNRHPEILSVQEKHALCLFFQNNKFEKDHKGAVKDYILYALKALNINISESTFRMAKRLYYKFQDPEITSLYDY